MTMQFIHCARNMTLASLVLPLNTLAAGVLATDNPANNAKATGIYAQAEAFLANQSLPMQQYASSWQSAYAPAAGDNLGLLAARVETGAQWQGYRLGLLYRADALIKANRDSTDLVWQSQTNAGYNAGRTYQINYQIKGFEANGVRMSKSFATELGSDWQMKVGAGASLLKGKTLKLETLTGQIIALSAKDFDARVSQSSFNTQEDVSGAGKFNPGFAAKPALNGQGYAFDLGTTLEHTSGLRFELAINDIAGQINWKGVPGYVANYNTATKYFDAQGFVHFNPTASSQSSFVDLQQTLDPKIWLSVAYPVGTFEFQLASSYTQGQLFPEIGLSYAISPQWRTHVSYDTHFGTLAWGLKNQWFNVALRTDSTDLTQAKAYGLTLGLSFDF